MRVLLAALLLLLKPAAVLSECADHWPCCVCLTNLCPPAKFPTPATCSACTADQEKRDVLVSSKCHCEVSDFEPYCNSTTYACDLKSNRCLPRPGGRFPSAGDCLADGCGQPTPAPRPPGPPPGPVPGGLWLSSIFASNMVLQAERSSIHGHAKPGASVTLAASPARVGFPTDVKAGDDGVWNVSFGSQVSNAVLTNITITSGAGTVVLSQVLWGDVILCSGQSNMGVPTSYILNSTAAIAAAAALEGTVRLLRVASGTGQATTPHTSDNVALNLQWTRATPSTVASFSAVCWTFALGLAEQRPAEFARQRPLGLVLSMAAGTPVEAWMPAQAVGKCPGLPPSAGCQNIGNLTSGLFNEQIAPLAGMVFKLAVWYQGESNALWHQFPHDAHTGDSGYTCRYAGLIEGWRSALSFVGRQGWLTVQIAPVLETHSQSMFPSIRLSQQTVGDSVPGVGTVVIQDLGDALSPPPAGSMHPRLKRMVGIRLALAALALGFIGEGSSSPPEHALTLHGSAAWGGATLGAVTRDGASSFTVQLGRAAQVAMVGSSGCENVTMFDDGLTRSTTERCCNAPDTFQLWPSINATEQPGAWRLASSPTNIKCTIVDTALKCIAPAPIAGTPIWTFAWQDYPPCMLMNEAQLPASPMRAMVPAQ